MPATDPTDPRRLGFCCLYIPPNRDKAETKRMNVTSTTIAALSRLDRAAALDKVTGIVRHNLAALAAQLDVIAALSPLQRLLRLSSDVLPAYTHPVARWMYDEPDLHALVRDGLAAAGAQALRDGIRLSLHPGPFCVLAAVGDATVANSVAELEYHTDLMRWLGHAGGWHPHGAHVNIHVGSTAGGLDRFRAGLALLSDDARGLVTLENDEVAFGLQDVLRLADALPIVTDFHHHWIASQGEYLQPDDPRLDAVRHSWRGTRPVSHISVSQETLFPDHPTHSLPDYRHLIDCGFTARDLRVHSEYMWNDAVNDWMIGHLRWTDIEVEAKGKNLASAQLAARAAA